MAMTKYATYIMVGLAGWFVSLVAPGCQNEDPDTIDSGHAPAREERQATEDGAAVGPDAPDAGSEEIATAGKREDAPERDVSDVLICLLPEKLQKLLLLDVDADDREKALQAFRIRRALVTGRLEPVLDDVWRLVSEERDEICTETIFLDGADCGCERYLERMECDDHPHVFPPTFSACEVVRRENQVPDLVMCLSDDRSWFRIAYAWRQLLVVKDWPPRMLARMERLDARNHDLCVRQHERRQCEKACDIREMTYERCKAECTEAWDRMHDPDAWGQEAGDPDADEAETDEEAIKKCQQNCRQDMPSDSAFHVDEVEILAYRMSEPGVFELEVHQVEGLVDEDDRAGKTPLLPTVQHRKVVLHDPLIEGGKPALDQGLADKRGVWISDLDELSDTATGNEAQEYYDAPGRLSDESRWKETIAGHDRHIETQLIDILLSNRIDMRELVEPLPDSLGEQLSDLVEKDLTRIASCRLFRDLIEGRDPARQTTFEELLTGIEVRLGVVPQDLILGYLSDEPEEEWLDGDEPPMDEIFHCPHLERETFRCNLNFKPRVMVCQAYGVQMVDRPAAGEAWVVGLDSDKLPAIIDWLRDEQLDELVPESKVEEWINQHLADGARALAKACSDGCSHLGPLWSNVCDKTKQRKRLESACEQKDAEACAKLGYMLVKGVGGFQNKAKARGLFDESCSGGFSAGCLYLGIMWSSGEGGARDKAKARGFYQQACDGGHAKGCYNLGIMSAKGIGGPRDRVEERASFRKACDGGFLEGCYSLGILLLRGTGGPARKAQARKLFESACEGGMRRGCHNLGVMWNKGEGGPQSSARARMWFDKANQVEYEQRLPEYQRSATSNQSAARSINGMEASDKTGLRTYE